MLDASLEWSHVILTVLHELGTVTVLVFQKAKHLVRPDSQLVAGLRLDARFLAFSPLSVPSVP